MEFISFLEEHHVDLTNVKVNSSNPFSSTPICCLYPFTLINLNVPRSEFVTYLTVTSCFLQRCAVDDDDPTLKITDSDLKSSSDSGRCSSRRITQETDQTAVKGKPLLGVWNNGTGPRIGVLKNYPAELKIRALEQVKLSPRAMPGLVMPVPSPRPSPKIHLSPSLACMGLPSPRVHHPTPN